MRLVFLLISASVALAQTPPDVLKFFREAAEALADGDSRAFVGNFDRDMPGYATLREEVEGLLAGHEVASTIEVVNDEGDNRKRALDLDWLLSITDVGQRRQIVKCTIERRGKVWKITGLEPIGFFKPG